MDVPSKGRGTTALLLSPVAGGERKEEGGLKWRFEITGSACDYLKLLRLQQECERAQKSTQVERDVLLL